MTKTSKPTTAIPPRDDAATPAEKPETPMPTGSGVLGTVPREGRGAASGTDLEAAERRRFERAIKEKS